MGRYVGNEWHEELPSSGPQDQVQNNTVPTYGGGGYAPQQDTRAVSTNPYGDGMFQTPNGLKSGTQIVQELKAVGWDGQGDPVTVYNRTASGGGGTPAAPGTTAATGVPGMPGVTGPTGTVMNTTGADAAAYRVYLNSKLKLETEEQAFQHAQQAWMNEITKAGLTGSYEGQQTLASQLQSANMLGTYQGQQTQAAQEQAFRQGREAAALTGTYQGAPTQAAQEQAYTQWLRGAQEARQNQALQQQTANQYLTLLGQMRGPQNYFQYQNVLGATPGGMRDLVGAAMGQYIPGAGATTGVNPQAQSLQGMANDVTGANQVYSQQQQAMASQLPAPNQIAPQSWNNLAPSQRQLLMSAYENQGWNAEDVKGLFEQSLPKYGTQAPSTGTFKLV